MSEYAWMSLNKQESGHASGLKYAIFLPWKVPWNWIAFSQNSFVISTVCYITWLDATVDDLQTRSLRQILFFLRKKLTV